MKIILANNTEIALLSVTYRKNHIKYENWDTLTFEFSADEGLDKIDALFTAENCEKITVVDDDDMPYTHNGYTVRAALSKEAVKASPTAEESGTVYENRIIVIMAHAPIL